MKNTNKKTITFRVYCDNNQTQIVFADSTNEMQNIRTTFIGSYFVALSSAALLSVLSWVIAKAVIKPYEKTYQNEKRFLTDASHELKTPLTVIYNNNELMIKEYGDNKHTESTKKQIGNMMDLIAEMITLNKLNEVGSNINHEEFSLTDSVYEAITSYDEMFVSKGITFDKQIEENINIYANEESIFKLY